MIKISLEDFMYMLSFLNGMRLSEKAYFGLGRVPIGIGAVIKGWDITEEYYRDPTKLPAVDFRAMTNACSHDCHHCYTDKNPRTLTLTQIKGVIKQLALRKTYSINYLGEGEPTLDKNFFEIIEYTSANGIIPVVFTDAATRLLDKGFVRRLYDSGASVIPKCDSLFNAKYQNWIVRDKSQVFFDRRNKAIELLMEEGFNEIREDGTTRLGFDMVLSSRNMGEVERTLIYCRDRNLWIIFAFHLPSGRSAKEDFDSSLIVSDNKKRMIKETVRKVDLKYEFKHPVLNNFLTRGCIEFMQIFGDGRVSPCPGNETIIGNVKEQSIDELEKRILESFPCHNRKSFDGICLYRNKVD